MRKWIAIGLGVIILATTVACTTTREIIIREVPAPQTQGEQRVVIVPGQQQQPIYPPIVTYPPMQQR
jgi:hypothetical protein